MFYLWKLKVYQLVTISYQKDIKIEDWCIFTDSKNNE